MIDRAAWSWVLLLAATALLLWPLPAAPAARRIRALRAPPGAAAGPPTAARAPAAASVRRRWAWAGTGGLAAGLLMGGLPGVVAGITVAAVVERLLAGRQPAHDAAARTARSGELPGACDLLAVSLSAGLPIGEALSAVGSAVPGPLGADLRHVAALYRLGADPRRAWSEVPAELSGLARTLVRAGQSGSAVEPALRALAADVRAAERAAIETAVRRAGVWVLAPLGLCFLPAFVCLGVMPLVLGIAGEVFG